MKKRITVILLSLLLLSSCASQNNPDNSGDDQASADGNPQAENNSETIESDGKAVINTDPNVFIIQGELPNIGEFSGKKKQHFHGEFTPEFIPSSEYGEIIPYIGSYKVYSNKESDWQVRQGYSTFGFCTADGRIVMDATEANSHVTYYETEDGFGYYLLSRYMEQREDAPDEYLANENLVIPKSGKWCKSFGVNIWVQSAGNGMIVVCEYPLDGNPVKNHIYDYDGNVILELEGYDNVDASDSGLIRVMKYGNDSFHGFMNEDGEIVLGPYESVSSFSENGIASVQNQDGEYFLINSSGRRITDGDYDNISIYSDDKRTVKAYQARHRGSRTNRDVLDAEGNIIGTITDGTYASLYFPENGDIIYNYSVYRQDINLDSTFWKKLSDGSDFVSKELGVSPNQYGGGDNHFIYKDEEANSGIIFDGDGETIAAFDDFCSFIAASDDGRYITYTSGMHDYDYNSENGETEITDTRKTHIYDVESGESIYTADLGGYASFIGIDDRYVKISYSNEYDVFGGYIGHSLYDTEKGELLVEMCNEIYHTTVNGKDYFNICTDSSFTLYDGEMNVILRTYNE